MRQPLRFLPWLAVLPLLSALAIGCGDDIAVTNAPSGVSIDGQGLGDLGFNQDGAGSELPGADGSLPDVDANTAPVLTFTFPAADAIWQAGTPITLELTAQDDGGPAALTLQLQQKDGAEPLWTGKPQADGKVVIPLPGLPSGALTLVAHAIDIQGLSTKATLSLFVNTAPGAPVVAIAPTQPTTLDMLKATVVQDAVDPDRKPGELKYAYAWAKDGQPTGELTAQVAAGIAKKGETWKVMVTASDPTVNGTPGEAQVVVQDALASTPTVVLDKAEVDLQSEVSASASGSVDPDGDEVSYTYQWLVNGKPVAGATTAGVKLAQLTEADGKPLKKDDKLACVATASSSGMAGGAQTSIELTVAGFDVCSSSLNPCDLHATCVGTETLVPVCTCNKGFGGDGKYCGDLDECLVDNGGCGLAADCSNTVGGFTCACKPGYSGSSGGGTDCTDIDECAKGTSGCDGNATCANQFGGATCTCKSGFSGDGKTCTDIDECTTDNGGCGPAAFWKCSNQVGGVPQCSDIDDCATDNGGCGDAKYWSCKNNLGAAPTCADIDECADSNGGCGDAKFVTCANKPGAAPTCTDIDECAKENGGCGDSLFYACSNQPGGPAKCADIDECATDNGGCGDAIYVKCVNELGKPATCVDIDECATDNGKCGPATLWKCTDNKGDKPTCSDIDECATSNGGCGDPKFFQCVNQTGATAQCSAILLCGVANGGCGDSKYNLCTEKVGGLPECSDIDECKVNNGGCGNAQYFACSNLVGGPAKCADIDECLVNNGGCGDPKFNTCANNVGGLSTCSDIDECATDNGGCGDPKFWACKNNDGAGPTCSDIDECAAANGGCGSAQYTVCGNQPGSAPTCTDIDECKVNNGGCGDAKLWLCTNQLGKAQMCSDIDECLVDNGGCGDAKAWSCKNNAGGAPTCSDVDECKVNNGGCGAKNTCTNKPGSYLCSFANCVAVRDANLPSGEYSVDIGGPRTVYCDNTTAGGGWTYLKPGDIQALSGFDLNAWRTDKAEALVRLVGSYGQGYTVLKQLANYAAYPLAVAVYNGGGASPGAGYNLRLTMIPLEVAKALTTQGFNSNGQELTFVNCDSNPNSYFEFYAAGAGYDFAQAYALTNSWLASKAAGGSLPAGYFSKAAMHDGGCGAHNTSSYWTGVDGTTGAALGLR
jgi:hypothetical protein